jgi:hypothetical protein
MGKKFASYFSDRGLISRIHKELKTFNRTNNPVDKFANEMNSFQMKYTCPINT